MTQLNVTEVDPALLEASKLYSNDLGSWQVASTLNSLACSNMLIAQKNALLGKTPEDHTRLLANYFAGLSKLLQSTLPSQTTSTPSHMQHLNPAQFSLTPVQRVGVDTGLMSKVNMYPYLVPNQSAATLNASQNPAFPTMPAKKKRQIEKSSCIKNVSPRKRPRKRNAKPKLCTIEGCTTQDKGGGFCAKHGGGRPCAAPGCAKRVAGTRFCSEHGGTRKRSCSAPGCIKGDQGGGYCAAHGGGKRCSAKECSKRAVGGGLCWKHGGGKRCNEPSCLRSPRRGGYCKYHGPSAESLAASPPTKTVTNCE